LGYPLVFPTSVCARTGNCSQCASASRKKRRVELSPSVTPASSSKNASTGSCTIGCDLRHRVSPERARCQNGVEGCASLAKIEAPSCATCDQSKGRQCTALAQLSGT
jgi:hypothetical protein